MFYVFGLRDCTFKCQNTVFHARRLLADKEDSIMKLSVLNLDVNGDGKKKKGCCSK